MIPKSWNDITVEQFIEWQGLRLTPAASLSERYIDTIILLTDLPVEDVEDMPLLKLSNIIKEMSWLNTQPTKTYSKKFGNYEVLPFNKITWGMFIDLEYYYTKNYVQNMNTICGILLRQVKKNKWGVIEYEPYKYDPKQRGSIISHLPITSVYGLITSYLDYRNDLINVKYSNLFESDIEEDEEPDLTGVDLKEYQKGKEAEKRFNKWAYESITLQLAENDITKMDAVLNKPLIYVLNILSMKSDLK